MPVLLEPTLITRETRDTVYNFEPQAKVLALLYVLSSQSPDGLVPWATLRAHAFAVPLSESLLCLADGSFDDIEPILKDTLINLHGQDLVKVSPLGIRLLKTDTEMQEWNNHFRDRCDLAKRLFFPENIK